MAIETVSDKLYEYLISGISGDHFESLAKRIFGGKHGDEYVPLGGMHDGGADGFMLPHVLAGKTPDTYFQFSVTDGERAKTKVVGTIEALRNAGRIVRHIIYSTSEQLPKQDILAKEIFNEHNVLLIVRDRERIKQMVNTDTGPNRAFWDFFGPEINTLKDSAKSLTGAVNQFVQDPTVFALLDYELKDRFSKDQLHRSILDSLIYWSLRETDPDQGKFLARGDIAHAVESIFPNAAKLLLPHLDARLENLSHKNQGEGDRIRHHTKGDLFCIPFDMRKKLAERAIAESTLQDAFNSSIQQRLREIAKDVFQEDELNLGAELIFSSVHEYFVEQGMILSAFLNNKVETIHISDQIVEDQVSRVLEKSQSKSKISPALVADALRVLRVIFYEPTDVERDYLGYLSRTSLLFMTLQSAPKMIEYFNQMGGNFRLLVGTDLLVKSISEQHLPPERQQVGALLRACMELGATLVLTEPVLNELFTHLHAVDLEYRNHYLPNEAYLTSNEVSECDRILIRAYYYSRQIGGPKISWEKFIGSLLDAGALRTKSEKGKDDLRGLLVQRFRMEYLSNEDIRAGVNENDLRGLAEKLKEGRGGHKHEELSLNDALMVYATYAQRRKHKESAIYDGFGYRTWWLTKEIRVLSYTGQLVMKEGGVPYIMRPEFILNFIALAPNAGHVRKVFRNLLPTTVGLQLGQHLKAEDMQKLLAGTEEWASLPAERVAMIIGERVNKLKYDRFKQYTSKI